MAEYLDSSLGAFMYIILSHNAKIIATRGFFDPIHRNQCPPANLNKNVLLDSSRYVSL